jgi:DNA-binding CsgD family transcriptional regulator
LGSSILAQVVGADALTRDWMANTMRLAVGPDTALAMQEAYVTFDVSGLLGRVQAPTLVMHRRDDGVFSFERGRELAAGIPHARFLPLDGWQHALYQGEDQDVLRAVTAYLEEPAIAARFTEQAEPSSPDGLSEREVRVLRLVAAGKSNREIADWLVISPHTVIRHVSNIFDKIGVANRTEAATYAARHGLIE